MGEAMNTEINLIQNIKGIMKPYCFRGAKKGINVWVYYQPPIDEVFMGDVKSLNQEIADLMESAIKNTVEGYIILEVKQIKSCESKTVLQFSVRHTGVSAVHETNKSSGSMFYFNAELERKLVANS